MNTEKFCVAIYNENCIQRGHAVSQGTLGDYAGDWRDGGDWTVYEGLEADIIEYAAGMVHEKFPRPYLCRSARTLLESILWEESRIDWFIDNHGSAKPEPITADDFVEDCEFPIFFYAGVGCPGGQSIAILEDTDLPVDLIDIEGEVKDGIFEATNLSEEKRGWKFSDYRANTIYKIQIFSDQKIWESQKAE
jgi:hypothetical protein